LISVFNIRKAIESIPKILEDGEKQLDSGHRNNKERMPTMLGQIIRQHMEETVTDEQAERVLGPIGEMIFDGKFTKKPRRKRKQIVTVIISGAALIAITLATVLIANIDRTRQTEIPQENLTLATPLTDGENTLAGRITWQGEGVENVRLALVDTDGIEISGTVITDQDGSYTFHSIPDGSYLLIAIPPLDTGIMESLSADTWMVSEGNVSLILEGNMEILWQGSEVTKYAR